MLEVKQLNVSYGASQALYDVDFHADLGEISCVLGRNGVGKTSLVRAIAGRHIASSGQILWNTAEIRELDPAARAQQGIAYVPQGREIFARLTVAENLEIAFAAAPKGQRFIPDEIFALFPVLEQMLSRRGGDLSGGQQQQLAIARALITRPKLLILDEPTEGIQPSIIKDIGRVLSLLRERGDMAIVLVEQYLDFALDLCDRLCVLDRGRVKLAGQAQEVDQTAVRGLVTV
ncbi:MAG: urea ABC transporter ATP-binding subunit UrtE [Litorivicinaceae bacterium]|nr:MAG: urea ABC transporter ATP-binding subunit UrtE [Litorivicinaceae bacterium]|tara:strand:- start:894 stop:1589 length:696 start_codon:yes stop_codon:yes gene_type:complete